MNSCGVNNPVTLFVEQNIGSMMDEWHLSSYAKACSTVQKLVTILSRSSLDSSTRNVYFIFMCYRIVGEKECREFSVKKTHYRDEASSPSSKCVLSFSVRFYASKVHAFELQSL